MRTEPPRIPDHEMLRCIGKGSYGEVWLGRSVTGALRAVKVVRREDFELDRTFEREFEGIRKFEPVSREHPGLVHVLHVGRNEEEKFYYYVMELGDDRERGSRVDPADYEPRTMGVDRQTRQRLTVRECLEHGAQIAFALAHMHEHGLTHRDIKPANIIFVNGKAKLADIGLVAETGQKTFVGTEGFVPPEGPGTEAADIYSLGMVLYELSTGKDRMQFPELPSGLGDPKNRQQWRALNEIICKACAPNPKKRYPAAREMAEALEKTSAHRAGARPFLRKLATVPVASAALAFGLVTWRHGGAMPWPPGRFVSQGDVAPPVLSTGSVSLTTDPAGADVFFDGLNRGRTPLRVEGVPPGEATFTLRRNRYKDITLTVSGVRAAEETIAPPVTLTFFNPPRGGQEWRNSLDMAFDPMGDEAHLSRRPVSYDQFVSVMPIRDGGDVRQDITPDNEILYVPVVTMKDAIRFCRTLTEKEVASGWLREDLCYRPEPWQPAGPAPPSPAPPDGETYTSFRCVVERCVEVTIISEPSGATVYDDDVNAGVTPWTTARHRAGHLNLRIEMKGYDSIAISETVAPGETFERMIVLETSRLADFAKDWKNSLGLTFKSIGGDFLCCTSETRIQDYAAFAAATGTPILPPAIPDMPQDGVHPVVNVTRENASAFCRWLTDKERASGYLDRTMEYRLPSDLDWSFAAGSPNLNDKLTTPAQRNNAITSVYPWVPPYEWPPPRGSATANPAGNLGDLSALKAGALASLTPEQIEALKSLPYPDGEFFDQGYDDHQIYTAPVGSFAPNGVGLYDLSGNAAEFVSDDYGEPGDREKFAVTRGGSWATSSGDREALFTHHRQAVPPGTADSTTGFRIIVARVSKGRK